MSGESVAMGASIVRMANQITSNFCAQGEEKAIEETVNHIRLFWDPRMKDQAFSLLENPNCGFSEIARTALSQLAKEAENRAV